MTTTNKIKLTLIALALSALTGCANMGSTSNDSRPIAHHGSTRGDR